jgi:hypothetical protein
MTWWRGSSRRWGIACRSREGRVIETKNGVMRLLTILERARVLFDGEGAEIGAYRTECTPHGPVQVELLLGDRGGREGCRVRSVQAAKARLPGPSHGG